MHFLFVISSLTYIFDVTFLPTWNKYVLCANFIATEKHGNVKCTFTQMRHLQQKTMNCSNICGLYRDPETYYYTSCTVRFGTFFLTVRTALWTVRYALWKVRFVLWMVRVASCRVHFAKNSCTLCKYFERFINEVGEVWTLWIF